MGSEANNPRRRQGNPDAPMARSKSGSSPTTTRAASTTSCSHATRRTCSKPQGGYELLQGRLPPKTPDKIAPQRPTLRDKGVRRRGQPHRRRRGRAPHHTTRTAASWLSTAARTRSQPRHHPNRASWPHPGCENPVVDPDFLRGCGRPRGEEHQVAVLGRGALPLGRMAQPRAPGVPYGRPSPSRSCSRKGLRPRAASARPTSVSPTPSSRWQAEHPSANPNCGSTQCLPSRQPRQCAACHSTRT